MARALKQEDVLEVSKLFEAEFNQPDLHDRVLIFDVVAPRSFSSVSVEEDERRRNETRKESEDDENDKAEIQETATQKIENKLSNEDDNGQKEKLIRQHKFYIHSAWLAVQSSYFRSLFFSGMKESNTKEVHVQISTSEEQAHLMLLEAMYKIDTLDNASVDELLEVLRLAHKYDAKFVFKKCKYVLKDVVDSLEICEDIMRFIKVDNTITDVEDLVSTLQSFLAKEFSPIDKTWQTTRFKELCERSLKYLLSSDELVTVSENTVFHALMHWIEERGIENVLESQELPPLLSVVRFELMPIDYLYNIVQHHPVAKKLMDFTDHYLKGISYHALSDTMKNHLPHQPVKRKVETQPFVAFTWVIPTHRMDATTPGITDKTLKSEEFWFCGYKTSLVITDIAKAGNLYVNNLTFRAKLSLEIRNLTQESEVSIQWQPTSDCFVSTPFEQRHTFDGKEGSLSSMDITYNVEVQERRSNTFGIVPAPTTQSSFKTGTASFMPSGLFSGVPAPITQSSFNIRAASPAPSGLFSGVPAPITQSNFNIRAASPAPSGLFSGVPAPTTQSSFNIRAASPAPSGFSVTAPTTQSSFNIRAVSPAPSGIFSGVPATTTQPSFNMSEQETSNSSCVQIDVIMKLL